MANNRIQFKRTSTTGLLPNTTNSANAAYISAGEFAVNLTDKRVISSDGSATFEVGANITNQVVTGNLSLTTNAKNITFVANGVAPGNVSSLTLQGDNNFVFYQTATDGSQRAIWANFTNSNTSAFNVVVPLKVESALQDSTGSNGTSGYVLTSNGTAVNWAAANATYASNSGALGGTSLATLQGQITGNAASAYSNAVANAAALYQTTAGLSANIAAYLPTYTGVVNASSYTIGSSFNVNSSLISTTSNFNTSGSATINGGVTIGSSPIAHYLYDAGSNQFAIRAGNTTVKSYYVFYGANGGFSALNGGITGSTLTSTTNTSTIGTSTYFVANGNVGIGTSSPSYKLDVAGSIGLSETIYDESNTSYYLKPSGTSVLNTVNVASNITVYNTPTVGQYSAVAGSGSTWYNTIFRNDGTAFYIVSSSAQTTQAAAMSASWSSYRPFVLYFSSGNVVINADNSSSCYFGGYLYDYNNTSYYLKPSGTSVLYNIIPGTSTNSGGGLFYFGQNSWSGSSPASTSIDASTGIQYIGGSGSQLFTISSAPGQCSLQMDGSLFVGDSITYNPAGINGATDGSAIVAGSLAVGGPIFTNSTLNSGISSTSSLGSGGQLQLSGYNSIGGTGYHGILAAFNSYSSATNPYKYIRINSIGGLEFINSAYNAVLFTMDNSGNFTASGNVTAYSDRKLKRNFVTITDALNKVGKLSGQTFTRIDQDDTTKRFAGLIAQEVEEVLPEAVNLNETMSYGEVKSVDYNATIALLVEAIKELNTKVETLQAELENK